MNATERIAHGELWRAWDPARQWKQCGEWAIRPRAGELREGTAVTVDYSDGGRVSFRVVGGELQQEWEHPATSGTQERTAAAAGSAELGIDERRKP